MAADSLGAPPVLSTPDTHILEDASSAQHGQSASAVVSDQELEIRYEITRTIQEIRERKWRRVALQFPDEMLAHSARVYQLLAGGLRLPPASSSSSSSSSSSPPPPPPLGQDDEPVKLTILADTSYGSCCVDEIAAEHVDADAVVHYGRSCLSPTARLPVLYVYTKHDLDYDAAVSAFQAAFSDRAERVIVTADVPYSDHVKRLCSDLSARGGYTNLFAADIIHDPASAIPNRTVPTADDDTSTLRDWHLFHISEPPTSLLLTLSSSVASIHVFQTDSSKGDSATTTATARLLRRRYALVTSLSTVAVWGILINTLSVQNYLGMVGHVQRSLAAAGKKSYLFVVGKINVAKVSNFSEVGGWVVIGCWESSLIDSRDFFRPIITPFELGLALQPDDQRQWTGEWRADFQTVLTSDPAKAGDDGNGQVDDDVNVNDNNHDNASDDDSDEAPEFDLRTGKYVARSRTRPMAVTGVATTTNASSSQSTSTSLVKRAAGGAVIAVNGVASPGAQYLREQRTWRGLGSDYEIKYDEGEEEEQGALIEQGRSGIAAGYTVGESESR